MTNLDDDSTTPPPTAMTAGRFHFRPGVAIVRNAPGLRNDLDRLSPSGDGYELRDSAIEGFQIVEGDFDPIRVVAALRALGYVAQPDHVFLAHDCCCSDHPADLLANPLRATPLRATPLRATPLRATPLRATPLRATPLGERSSALPADPPVLAAPPASDFLPRVAVLDTGLAAPQWRPPFLQATTPAGQPLIGGVIDGPDANGDQWLDPVAGHGTFIAGLLLQHAGPVDVEVLHVTSPEGFVSESAVVAEIEQLTKRPVDTRPHFLSLSFGGFIWEIAPYLLTAILTAQLRGIVVVASAGNDATCEPTYPAAFPNVVSVASVGPSGPSDFSNYGDWVRACAPGEDLVSSFFDGWNGKNPPEDGGDRDEYHGWAVWSGTSFAAPLVVAALIREMRRANLTPAQAVDRLIDAPHLARIPGMGTVVNV